MIEFLGIIGTIIAVIGVYLNNWRLRFCFILFIISNIIFGGLHLRLLFLGNQTFSLVFRDIVFLCLAVHGFYKWKKADIELDEKLKEIKVKIISRQKSKKRNRKARK